MVRITSRQHRWMATLLIDGSLLVAFFWPTTACGCSRVPELGIVATHELSTGHVMHEVAAAQEAYHQTHSVYARDARALELTRPGWTIAILDASATAYRARVSTSAHSCILWRNRLRLLTSERFYVDCGVEIAARGVGQDLGTAPHNSLLHLTSAMFKVAITFTACRAPRDSEHPALMASDARS